MKLSKRRSEMSKFCCAEMEKIDKEIIKYRTPDNLPVMEVVNSKSEFLIPRLIEIRYCPFCGASQETQSQPSRPQAFLNKYRITVMLHSTEKHIHFTASDYGMTKNPDCLWIDRGLQRTYIMMSWLISYTVDPLF